MAQQSSPDVDQILSTIRQVESSNNYGAQAKGSSASGAYQFIDSTWQASTKKSGLGTEYSRAKDAPPEVQDAVAAFAVRDILNRTGNDVSKVPLVWYTGNPEGRMTEDALRANQGLTPDKYQQKWLSVLGGGAPAQTAQAPRTTAQGPKQVGARVAAAFNPRDLPSSYTSALALNYLADTDPEGLTMSKVNEMLTEMIEDGGGAAKPAGGKILQQFAQAKSVDPFQFVLQQEEAAQPKQRAVPRMPKMFADGGEVGEQYESLEDVMAAAPTQDAEQRQWEQEIPVRELTRQLNETVDRYRAGRASEADVKQFFPNYSDYDIANMFGMTDAGQSGPRPEITAQPFLTPEVYDRAMNRGRMEEYNVEREIREKSPNIYPNKRGFTLQLQQLADGGEVNYDQMAEQMTVGTLLPPEQYIPVPMVRPGVSVPTMSEVPRVDAQGRVIREAPTPDQVYTPGQKIIGGAEALGATLSGLTAPASILYDVARGVPAKEISPGRFMYEPRTEAGQEYTQNISRLAQDLKLDAALPQVQLQRPYPVGAMARQAADIATGPIDRAKIRAAASRVPEDIAYDPLRERLESQGILSLAVKPGKEIDYSLLRPGENTPFVGELERIVADLPGPVRLQEFVNRVNKTARGYEKDRLDEFVERIKNTSSQPIDQIKLTPQQILDGLKETSPKRFLSNIIEPTEENQRGLWVSQDNPLKGKGNKVGTINLSLEVAPQINALSKQLDNLRITASELPQLKYEFLLSKKDGQEQLFSNWRRSSDQIKSAVNELSDFDPPSANRINESIKYADEIIDFAPKFEKEKNDLLYPVLSDEYNAWKKVNKYSQKDADKLLFKIKNNALENLRSLFDVAERREFITSSDATLMDFPAFYEMIKEFDKKTNDITASSMIPRKLSEDEATVRQLLVSTANKYGYQILDNKVAMVSAVQNELENFADKVRRENVDKFIYPGAHTTITKDNPISFSRFVDLTPEQITSFNIPLKDNNRGAMLVMELQSDRFRDTRPTIVLKNPKTGEVISERPNPTYKKDLEEAYPGMGKSGQIIQQLMIKNAIYGAMKRGKGLLLFPGTDSSKAHLYEKLGPNLKQVLKDLGPGFEIKQFTFPGKEGENATRFGVYIDEDAAKRVMTQGMRFSKGGMVDKPLYDRAV
jgi:hypothetical protein